jgi:transposase
MAKTASTSITGKTAGTAPSTGLVPGAGVAWSPLVNADGKRIRKKVSGQTKAEVRDKLKALHSELDAGVRTVHGYTVEKAVNDWLAGQDLVRRNVSALVDTPCGQEGRPSQSLTLEQASALLEAAEKSRLHAFIVLCLPTGVRSEEARALNLRRDFRRVTAAAGLGSRWVPKEMRTSFVSMMSYKGVPVEEIARLAGHASSRTTEVIYRRELRPVITTGAEVMDQIFRSRQSQEGTASVAGLSPGVRSRLVRETGKPTAQMARDLRINEETLGNWVDAHRRLRDGSDGALSGDEHAELVRLLKENAELTTEREVLKRSVALWVKDAMGRR